MVFLSSCFPIILREKGERRGKGKGGEGRGKEVGGRRRGRGREITIQL